MSRPTLQSVEPCHPIVAEAIARKLRITITVRIKAGWRNYRSEMISGARDSGRITIKTPLDRDDKPMPPQAMTDPWTACFRLGHKKFTFAGTIVDHCPLGGSDGEVVVRWPDRLVQMRRRSFQRAAPPKGTVIAVRFWKAGPPAASRDVRHAELENLSAGGIRLNASSADDLQIGDTFECLFTPKPGAAAIVAEALLRHREAAGASRASLGFQFIGLEQSEEGRHTLEQIARLVQDFHRSTRSRTHGG
jgi:hypothetical protein